MKQGLDMFWTLSLKIIKIEIPTFHVEAETFLMTTQISHNIVITVK